MKTKTRFTHVLNCLLLVGLILASCSGSPGQATSTPVVPTLTSPQQSAPPAVVETDPPLDSVIGHLATNMLSKADSSDVDVDAVNASFLIHGKQIEIYLDERRTRGL